MLVLNFLSHTRTQRYKEHCFHAAKFTSRILEKCGAVTRMIKPEGKNPIVLARFEMDPDAPTITFYGHYDVQVSSQHTHASTPSLSVARSLSQSIFAESR